MPDSQEYDHAARKTAVQGIVGPHASGAVEMGTFFIYGPASTFARMSTAWAKADAPQPSLGLTGDGGRAGPYNAY